MKQPQRRSSMKKLFAVLVIVLLARVTEAMLEKNTIGITEYIHSEVNGITDVQETTVTYSGALESRFSVLKHPTYWAKDCETNWKHPQDLVFTTEVRATTKTTLEYEWAEPVIVGEIFLMLTELSDKDLPLMIKMGDTGEKCKLERPLVETGYHSCEVPIKGSKLHITFLNERESSETLIVSALNIFPGKNLIM